MEVSVASLSDMQDLVDQIVQYHKTLEESSGRGLTWLDGSPSVPNPGATDAQLQQAERVLGHPYPTDLRNLLSIVNGWSSIFIGTALVGTEGPMSEVAEPPANGHASSDFSTVMWSTSRDDWRSMFADGWKPGAEVDDQMLQITAADVIPFLVGHDVASAYAVLAAPTAKYPVGTVLDWRTSRPEDVYPSVYDLLRELFELELNAASEN